MKLQQIFLMLLVLSMIDDLQGGNTGLVPITAECKAKGGGAKGPVTKKKNKGPVLKRIQNKHINGSLKDILTRLLMIQGFPLLILLTLCFKSFCGGSEREEEKEKAVNYG